MLTKVNINLNIQEQVSCFFYRCIRGTWTRIKAVVLVSIDILAPLKLSSRQSTLMPETMIIQEAGWTALMFAAKEGDMKILQQLISARADVNVVDKVGDMFVMVSVGWINVM